MDGVLDWLVKYVIYDNIGFIFILFKDMYFLGE